MLLRFVPVLSLLLSSLHTYSLSFDKRQAICKEELLDDAFYTMLASFSFSCQSFLFLQFSSLLLLLLLLLNSVTTVDAKKLVRIQRKSIGSCCNIFSTLIRILTIFVLMLLQFLKYENFTRENINLTHIVYLFFGVLNLVRLGWTVLVFDFPLESSEGFLSSMLVQSLRVVPP